MACPCLSFPTCAMGDNRCLQCVPEGARAGSPQPPAHWMPPQIAQGANIGTPIPPTAAWHNPTSPNLHGHPPAPPATAALGDREQHKEGAKRGKDLAAPSPLDTGISWARCQDPAAHTQALPPKPPNSRAARDAHAVAQPRPTAPFIFRLLLHGFPIARQKCRQGTGMGHGMRNALPCCQPPQQSEQLHAPAVPQFPH